MLVIGSVQLVVCRFVDPVLSRDVICCLRELQAGGAMNFVDLAYVSRDAEGILHANPETIDLGYGLRFTGTVLLQLLEGDHVDAAHVGDYEVRNAREVGFDIDAIEGLLYRIEPATAALLALVDTAWVKPLLDAVHTAGGAPLALGFLERETMLIVGPQLAVATSIRQAGDVDARTRGSALLDALKREAPSRQADVADTLTNLVRSGVLRPEDIAAAIAALSDAGLVSPHGKAP